MEGTEAGKDACPIFNISSEVQRKACSAVALEAVDQTPLKGLSVKEA